MIKSMIILFTVSLVYLFVSAFIGRKQRCCNATLGCALLLPRSRAFWWLFRWSGKPSADPGKRPHHDSSFFETKSDSWGVRASVILGSIDTITTTAAAASASGEEPPADGVVVVVEPSPE